MLQLLALPLRVLAAGGRQDVNARSIKMLFLKTELALALGELFVDYFSVERNHVRSELLKLLGKHDPPFGKISPRQLFHTLGWALDKVREPDPEFDYPFIVVVVKRFRHHAAFVEDGPELVGAAGVVVPHAHRRFTRIAADDDQLHALSQMVWQCSHLPSVAYFQFGVPCIRAAWSERSRPLGDDRVAPYAGSNLGPVAKPGLTHNVLIENKIDEFLAAE